MRRGEQYQNQNSVPSSPKVIGTPKMLRPIATINLDALESGRNISLAEKLSFYDESPRNLERRINTSHLPWGDCPGVYQQREDFQETIQNRRKSKPTDEESQPSPPSTAPRKVTLIDPHMLYHHAALLGNEGTEIMMQIIEDEKRNIPTSRTERKRLQTII